MRKSILSATPSDKSGVPTGDWLDLEELATVEMSSEDASHPFEEALRFGEGKGWRAGTPGPQTIRLKFDSPQRIGRIRLEFRETEAERAQEFALLATSEAGERREVVRQQWSFSPGGSTTEVEDYTVDLPQTSVVELLIDPGRHDKQKIASLQSIALGA
jgi:hypothetical protein